MRQADSIIELAWTVWPNAAEITVLAADSGSDQGESVSIRVRDRAGRTIERVRAESLDNLCRKVRKRAKHKCD